MQVTRSYFAAALLTTAIALMAVVIPPSVADDAPRAKTPPTAVRGKAPNQRPVGGSADPAVFRPREGLPLDISPEEAKLRGEVLEAIQRPVSIDCQNLPLSKVIAEITAGLPIRLKFDRKAIDDDGTVSLEDPVTHKTENEPVESILYDLLHPRGLTWLPRGDSLVITTWTEADSLLEAVAYDVTDLVVINGREADFSQLLSTITATIDPDTWQDVGGAGTMNPMAKARAAVLVVRQTFATQQKVARTLAALHRTGMAVPNSQPAGSGGATK